MACGCSKRSNVKYVWTSADGAHRVEYATEVQAKAKQIRAGGEYKKVEG